MPSDALNGQTVLISGAARRLGAQMARAAHERGANVAIHYRSSSADADQLVADLNAQRADSALAVAADLIDITTHESLIEKVVGHFGGLNALINNASTFYPTPVGSITSKDWDDLMGSNLKAPMFLSQAAAPELARRQGAIINLVDIHAQRPIKDHTVYLSAKAGLYMLTQSLAVDLGPDVRVNGISPGPIMWPENDITDATKASIVDSTLLKRSGDPTDIARTAMYFLTEAPFVTGQIIAVDGGRSLRP
ncbi:MAG: pteridine reductase [Gammaproteobacteria bacterium]